MWQVIVLLFTTLIFVNSKINAIQFSKDHIIFSSTFNITKLLVPADGNQYIHDDSSHTPSVFFTISDPKLNGGACIYVLEKFAAYEILEGGRDSTADYTTDGRVFFGAKDGVYIYDPNSLSAKKLGPFRDNIIQIQKATGLDKIFILTSSQKLYTLENNATIKTKVNNVECATKFVLDTSNNVYYVECGDGMIHILKADGTKLSLIASVVEDFKEIKLLRPPFIMHERIPFIGDGKLYLLSANGSYEQKRVDIEVKPSAFSVDAALYLVAAVNGKIYEFNVMEFLLTSMFGIGSVSPKDISKLIMSVMENEKGGVFELYKGFFRR